MSHILLMAGVFIAAFAIGHYLISRIPSLLHTPLMSMTNAISAATIIGAVTLFAQPLPGLVKYLGLAAITAAAFNVAGGFAITARMLRMFRGKISQGDDA